MSKDHYVFIGSRRAVQVHMPDKAIVPDASKHHLEPIRGSSYTLAVFDAQTWKTWKAMDAITPAGISAIGYCTAHSLGCKDAKDWMAKTGYVPFDKEVK